MTAGQAGPGLVPALAVRQPWAGAVAYAGKSPENRGWATAYRGPLAVHASQRWEPRRRGPAVAGLLGPAAAAALLAQARRRGGVVVAVVDLAGVHETAAGAATPWGVSRRDPLRRSTGPMDERQSRLHRGAPRCDSRISQAVRHGSC